MIQALSAFTPRVQQLLPTSLPAFAPKVRFGQDDHGDTLTLTQQGDEVRADSRAPQAAKLAAPPPIVETPKLTPLQMATQLTQQLTLIGDYLSDRLGSPTSTTDGPGDAFALIVPNHALTEVRMARGIDVNDMVIISRVQDELRRLEATFPTLEAMSGAPKSTDRVRMALRQLKTDEIFEQQRRTMLQGIGGASSQLDPATPYPAGMTPLSHAVEPVNTLYDTVLGLIEKESQGDMSHLFGRGGGGSIGQPAMIPGILMPGLRRFLPTG